MFKRIILLAIFCLVVSFFSQQLIFIPAIAQSQIPEWIAHPSDQFVFKNGGFLRPKCGPGENWPWTEGVRVGDAQEAHKYEEISRDPYYILLHDKQRNLYVALPYHGYCPEKAMPPAPYVRRCDVKRLSYADDRIVMINDKLYESKRRDGGGDENIKTALVLPNGFTYLRHEVIINSHSDGNGKAWYKVDPRRCADGVDIFYYARPGFVPWDQKASWIEFQVKLEGIRGPLLCDPSAPPDKPPISKPNPPDRRATYFVSATFNCINVNNGNPEGACQRTASSPISCQEAFDEVMKYKSSVPDICQYCVPGEIRSY